MDVDEETCELPGKLRGKGRPVRSCLNESGRRPRGVRRSATLAAQIIATVGVGSVLSSV